ncbi:hypothetical protein [Mesorhizobium sp. M8A.F.Ca.ET.207.01.1.1]|uniref:hypothetical protein n=1 Tax=Mesorhizobium sp. M8A.F.Ca.ET.207.01.1.1 TaxID=2563968 RepID=UPI0016719C7D|nr:hypothetical protein [Mesorhizobium sp. M8A.F.Ca.ET.207.01.1.1]
MGDDLHDRFKDLLQEIPEAEDALRAYRAHRNRQAMAVVEKRLREKNAQVLEEAYEWWMERRRQGKPPHPKD